MAEERAHIERLAGRLKFLVWGLMTAAAALYVAGRLGLGLGHVRILARGLADTPLPVAAGLLSDAGLLLLLLALWQLSMMLSLVEHHDRSSPRLTRCFRSFALLLLLATTVGAVIPLLPILTPPEPHQLVRLAVSLRDVLLMVVAAVLFLVARLLDDGQRAQADLREFV